jgi:hypothetical protein
MDSDLTISRTNLERLLRRIGLNEAERADRLLGAGSQGAAAVVKAQSRSADQLAFRVGHGTIGDVSVDGAVGRLLAEIDH